VAFRSIEQSTQLARGVLGELADELVDELVGEPVGDAIDNLVVEMGDK
jgi:hypothetical protein